MKKSFLILMVAMMSLTGCDFFRSLAGRPTSEEIQAKRLEILRAQQLVEEARLDSLRREKQAMLDSIAALDSLATLDSIRQQGGTILNPAKLGGLFATKLESRYYIIVGCFRQRTNAELLLNRASATLPRTRAEAPKPIMRQPEHSPFLSGNQLLTVEITTL